jgi:hypothetical protein
MVTQNIVISFEQLVREFDSLFQHRVFRLETLDYYCAENEREPYRRFLAGEPADWTWREPWKRIVRGHLAEGRIMQRVHVVSEPLSDYLRFQLLRAYPANVEAGEDVRILGRSSMFGVPSGNLYQGLRNADFWLFDDRLAAFLKYAPDGKVEHVELFEDGPVLQGCIRHREDTLRESVPLAQYVAEHNITEGKHAA